jgi:hypothetical protein
MAFSTIFYHKKVDKLFVSLVTRNNWSIDSTGESTKRKILKDARNIMIRQYAYFCYATVIMLIFLPIFEDWKSICLYEQMFERYFGTWSILPKVIFYATLPYIGYIMVIHCYNFYYVVFQLRIQFFLLNQHLEKISDDYSNISTSKLKCDYIYQLEMNKRLIFCIKQHIRMRRYEIQISRNVVRILFSA